MCKYFLSEFFTLVPAEVFSEESAERVLAEQFSLEGDFCPGFLPLEKEKAVIVYRKMEGKGESPLPFIIKLLEEASGIQGYNKVAFHYSHQKGLAHIVIYEGTELKLVNSFKADSFESALYFLFLSIKGLQMNPKQCTVRVCWGIEEDRKDVFTKFFHGFEINDLNTLLI